MFARKNLNHTPVYVKIGDKILDERIMRCAVNNYIQNYLFLCRCLSIDDSPESNEVLQAELQTANREWGRLIEIANQERVAPALWSALKRKDLLEALPRNISGMLKRRYSMNAILNDRIKREITEVLRCFNQIDIVPILLKGGAYLFDPAFGDPGARIMRDVDMLVQEDELDQSVQALFDTGYRIEQGQDTEWSYCYPALVREGYITPIEIHRCVGQQNTILPPREAWRDAMETGNGDVRVMTLSPTHQVFLNIFHSQVQDRGFELGLLWMRQLQDLAEIYRRHGGNIDWGALCQMMRRHGLQNILNSRMYVAHRLFGFPLPPEMFANTRAKLHYYRCMLLLRWPWAMWVTRMWAGLTAPFERYNIALIYGCSLNPLAINLHRIRHVWHIFQKYRGTILARAWERRRYDV